MTVHLAIDMVPNRRTLARLVVVPVLLVCGSAGAQVLRQVTDVRADAMDSWAIDQAGTRIVLSTTADPLGGNPKHAYQVVRFNLPGLAASVVVGPQLEAWRVSLTANGERIAFASPANPLGTNPDGSVELFVQNVDGTGLAQLTNHAAPPPGNVLDTVISGSGNRVLFIADTDPLGTNPDRRAQLFVIDSTGANLRQLTSGTGSGTGAFAGASISDDGSRIVFSRAPGAVSTGYQIFRILADGTGLTQVTPAGTYNTRPVISGNGVSIAYERFDLTDEIYLNLWGSGTHQLLANGGTPSITDDEKWVYYHDDGDLFRVSTSGGGTTQLTFTASPLYNERAVVAGDDSRVVFLASGGQHPGGNNPDGGPELMVMSSDGSGVAQVTVNAAGAGTWLADVTPDGTRAAFLRGPFDAQDVYRIDTDGSDLVRLTTGGLGYFVAAPQISSDGQRVVFGSIGNPLGTNPCGNSHVFSVAADGTGLLQLSPPGPSGDCQGSCENPALAKDSGLVVYQSQGNPTGGNPGRFWELFSVPATGGPVVQLTSDQDIIYKNPRVDAAGTWVVYASKTNFDAQNPGDGFHVFRARTDGSLVQRLTGGPVWSFAFRPDISADGSRIVWVSNDDPLGTNPAHEVEVFLYEPSTTTLTQLTHVGGAWDPRLSGNGLWVYFTSSMAVFEPAPAGGSDLYRVEVATGEVERVTGLRDPRVRLFNPVTDHHAPFAVDDSGRALFTLYGDSTEENPDLSRELWWADFDEAPRFEIEKGAPALVTWDHDPRFVRYDALRGDAAALSPGPGGTTVDLGPTVCLATARPAASAVDPDGPGPGEAFFYLHRGTQGQLDTSPTWGSGSGGAERVTSVGGCP